MKRYKLVICSFILLLITGCSKELVNKTIAVKDLELTDIEIYEEHTFNATYAVRPYSVDLNGISKNVLLGSILNKSADTLTFGTELFFTYKNNEFTQYEFLKDNRIIDYTIFDDELYYLTYFINGNAVLSELYKYVDGEDDDFIERFESRNLYNPPEITEYDAGFTIVVSGVENREVYKYENSELVTLFSEKGNHVENLVPSLTQVHDNTLYTIIAKESGNTIVQIDLKNNEVKEYDTDLKFGRYCVMDDYVVIFDENNKREVVFDKEMDEQWTSDLNVENVRWASYASGNTLVYSDNMSNDLFIRNYDKDTNYRISAESEDLLKTMPVSFYVDGNVIYTTNMDSNTLFTITFSQALSE